MLRRKFVQRIISRPDAEDGSVCPQQEIVTMIKSFEDVQDYGKQGFEAWMASATAMTKGYLRPWPLGRILEEVVREERQLFKRSWLPSRWTGRWPFTGGRWKEPYEGFVAAS